jgi:hypothetical protein
MAAMHPGGSEPTCFVAVRAVTTRETIAMARARAHGPFAAWRDEVHALRLHVLAPGEPVTIGRATDNTIAFEHLLVSRDHAEVLLRVRGQPASSSVLLLDLRSKHGTAHRPLQLGKSSCTPAGPLRPAPSQPAVAHALLAGDHDVELAGEVWIRIGGVPVDRGATVDRPHDLLRPTKREHDVLVELCRPQIEARGEVAPTPSNAEIGARVTPRIGAERVSDLLSQLYAKYGLAGTKEQNRFRLVDLALKHRLVRPEDLD